MPPSLSNMQASESRSEAENLALLEAIKRLKPKQKSELSKRGVVRVIYHATMDKEMCPLCAYLDGMGFFVVRLYGLQDVPLVWGIVLCRYGAKKEQPRRSPRA